MNFMGTQGQHQLFYEKRLIVMKKNKVLAALVATMAVGATCAFAANPFVDVPADSWAYQSVVSIANSGIIQGVDGKHFEGNRNITRYEAAEITAKALAHANRANAQQRAVINRLAQEFASELNNLGVRVSDLESRVGTVKLSGDARVRFRHQAGEESVAQKWKVGAKANEFVADGAATKTKKDAQISGDAAWDYNVHLNADAVVNDKTTVHFGVFTDDQGFASDAKADELHAFVNNANIEYAPTDSLNLQIGRIDGYTMGNAYGYQYGDVLDGAIVKQQNDQFAITAGYGKLVTSNPKVKTGFGEVEGFFGDGAAAGVYYNSFNKVTGLNAESLWGAYATAKVGGNVSAMVNYEQVNQTEQAKKDAKTAGKKESPAVWVGQLKFNDVDQEKAGSWDAWVEYLHAEDGAMVGNSSASWRADTENVKSWGIGVDYTLSKNVVLKAAQTLGSKYIDKKVTGQKNAGGTTTTIESPAEYTTVSLNFSF